MFRSPDSRATRPNSASVPAIDAPTTLRSEGTSACSSCRIPVGSSCAGYDAGWCELKEQTRWKREGLGDEHST